MYTVSDLAEIGTAEDLILRIKVEDEDDDATLPSAFAAEQFDE